MLARILFMRKLRASGLEAKFIQTIHDSLVVDTPAKNCYTVSKMLTESVQETPAMCKKVFNYDFSLPLTSELLVGPNKKDLVAFNLD